MSPIVPAATGVDRLDGFSIARGVFGLGASPSPLLRSLRVESAVHERMGEVHKMKLRRWTVDAVPSHEAVDRSSGDKDNRCRVFEAFDQPEVPRPEFRGSALPGPSFCTRKPFRVKEDLLDSREIYVAWRASDSPGDTSGAGKQGLRWVLQHNPKAIWRWRG